MVDIKKEIMALWNGRCTVRVLERETDEETGRDSEVERVIFENIPCHFTYYYYLHHAKQAETASVYQRGALFVERDVEIPYGSKITVVQNGRTTEYALSGAPVVYSAHREVPVSLFKRWV